MLAGRVCRPAIHPNRPQARNFTRDAVDLVSFVHEPLPKENRRIAIGHSMGGAITLLCLHDWPAVFDVAVLSAPMLEISTRCIPRVYLRWLLELTVKFGLGDRFLPGGRAWQPHAGDPEQCSRTSSDPRRSQLQDTWFNVRPELRMDAITYGWLASALQLTAQLKDPNLLREVRTPILIGSAGREVFIDPSAHARAAALLFDCTLVSFPNAKHELFLWRRFLRRGVTAVMNSVA